MEDKQRARGEAGAEHLQPEIEDEKVSPVRDLEEAYDDIRHRFRGMFEMPDDFVMHIRAARREFWLALRSLIDARIESIEEAEKRREAGRRSRVNIE